MIKDLLIPEWRLTQEEIELPVGSLDPYFDQVELVAKTLGIAKGVDGQVAIYLRAEEEGHLLGLSLKYHHDRIYASSDLVITSSQSGFRNEISLNSDDISPFVSGTFRASTVDSLRDYHPNRTYVNLITGVVKLLGEGNMLKITEPFEGDFSLPQ